MTVPREVDASLLISTAQQRYMKDAAFHAQISAAVTVADVFCEQQTGARMNRTERHVALLSALVARQLADTPGSLT